MLHGDGLLDRSAAAPRVVYWLNMPAPYFVERLNAVAERGNIDLEVWFNVVRESNRSWDVETADWHFRSRWIPQRSLLGWKQHLPLAELRTAQPDVFVMEWHRVHFALGFPPSMAYAGRTAVRVLPTWDEVSERTWWREGGKHWLFRSVDAAKGNRDGADLAARYGLPRARIAHVPQSIGGEHYSQALELDPDVRVQLREQLDVSGCVFVYAGRLIWKKGLDALFDAFAKVRALEPDVSLLILGDGFDEWHYRAAAQEIGGVSFTGFVRRSDLPCLYACGDVFVFPSLGEPNGLVLDEALAAGLPAISSDAVGDIHHRVRDGENGFVVASGDAEGMAARMLQLARDPDLRARLAAAAPASVRAPDHQIYAEAFERFVEQALRVPGRRSGGARAARGLGRAMVALGGRDEPAAVMAPRTAGLAQATVIERLRDPA